MKKFFVTGTVKDFGLNTVVEAENEWMAAIEFVKKFQVTIATISTVTVEKVERYY